MAKRGKQSSQAALNKALDDLLGDDIDAPIKPKSRSTIPDTNQSKNERKSTKSSALSSRSTDEDFYKTLSAMGVDDKGDESQDDVPMTSDDANKLANDLGDMDDLESSLFGFSKKKSGTTKAPTPTSTQISKKPDRKPKDSRLNFNFDDDDPLAGLGLSEDEDDVSTPRKQKLKKLDSHNRKIPQMTSKTKVDQDPSDTAQPQRSMSIESDDPFLASDPRPRSGSKSGLFQRGNSWEEPSQGTASEAELTPRGTGKHSRQGSKKKGKIQPGETANLQVKDRKMPKKQKSVDISFDSDTDLPGVDDDGSPSKKSDKKSQATSKSKSNEATSGQRRGTKGHRDEDMFGDDDDDLPGLDGGLLSPGSTRQVENQETETTRKATSALDDLLGTRSKSPESKTRKVTMLDQILSGNAPTSPAKTRGQSTNRGSSPDNDVVFGGYSPSVGGGSSQRQRPTTAPSRRSVRFADELGLRDDLQQPAQRPVSAPDTKRNAAKTKVKDNGGNSGIGRESKADDSDLSSSFGSPRRRRSPVTRGKEDDSSSDWLGLGDDLTAELGLSDTLEFNSPRNKDPPRKSPDQTASKNTENVTESSKSKLPNEQSPGKEESKAKLDTADELVFPWEQPGGQTRRRFSGRRSGEEKDVKLDQSQEIPPKSEDWKKENQDAKVTSSIPKEETKPQQTIKMVAPESASLSNAIKENVTADPKVMSQPIAGAMPGAMQHPSTPEPTAHPMLVPNAVQPGTFPPNSVHGQFNLSEAPNQSNIPAYSSFSQAFLSNVQFPQPSNYGLQAATSLRSGANGKDLRVLTEELSSMKLQTEKLTLEKKLLEDAADEYKNKRDVIDNERANLEAELKSLQRQVRDAEEQKTRYQLDMQANASQLDEKVRKLEVEKTQLETSLDVLKSRHKNEQESLEASYKMRFQILEDSYKHREERLKEEHELILVQLQERISANENERSDIVSAQKRKLELFEKNKIAELERLRELHKKAMDEMSKDYEDQIESLRQLKEREVQAAMSAFSQAKSLQSLIQEVHHSAQEVGFLKDRIERSHTSSLDEREQSIRTRDEYLQNLQERLYKQEAESDRERSRLQSLIAKLELQLKEQGRQIEQREWKINQDEARLKTLQAAFEEERRITMQQLTDERANVDKMREQMISEQKRVLTECYEERRKILMERSQPTILPEETGVASTTEALGSLKHLMQSELDTLRSRLNKENTDTFGLQKKLQAERDVIEKDKKELEAEKLQFKEDKMKMEFFVKSFEAKSSEMQSLFEQATSIHEEGMQAMNEAQFMKAELNDEAMLLNARKLALDSREKKLAEENAALVEERKLFQVEKMTASTLCKQCGLALHHNETQDVSRNVSVGNVSELPTTTSVTAATPSAAASISASNPQIAVSPPDLILNSLEFKRALRKWSAVREKDEEFLEEENKFLEDLKRKRSNGVIRR